MILEIISIYRRTQ